MNGKKARDFSTHRITTLRFSPQGDRLAAGSRDNKVR
jgi:WD40 repeat protein